MSEFGKILNRKRQRLGLHDINAAAYRVGLQVGTIELLEAGGGTFESAAEYAAGLGTRLKVVNFAPKVKPIEIERGVQATGLDLRTFMACMRVAASPANVTKNVTMEALEKFLAYFGAKLDLEKP